MARQLTHRELESLLGAYALDAVEPDEAEALELHLRECPKCRAEVAMHRDTAALMSSVGAPAPDGLWDKLVSSLEEPPPPLRLMPMAADADASAGARSTMPPQGVAGPNAAGAGSPGVFRGLRSLNTRGTAMLLAAAAVVALLFGVVALQRIDDVGRTVGEDGISRAVLAAQAHPEKVEVRLSSEDGSVRANAVLLPSGEGYLYQDNLPELPEGKTYQLWAAVGDQRISLGVLGRKPGIVPFKVAVDNVGALAVTAEASTGVKETAQPFVVSGYLSQA